MSGGASSATAAGVCANAQKLSQASTNAHATVEAVLDAASSAAERSVSKTALGCDYDPSLVETLAETSSRSHLEAEPPRMFFQPPCCSFCKAAPWGQAPPERRVIDANKAKLFNKGSSWGRRRLLGEVIGDPFKQVKTPLEKELEKEKSAVCTYAKTRLNQHTRARASA